MILALDIGTSSVRAALYDFTGNVVPETVVKKERTVHFTEDGGAELTADEAFSQVCEAIEEVLSKTSQTIDHVAASCFWHSLIGVDADGNATTNVFTWAETRPAKYVESLRANLNEEEVHNRTGARFHSSFWTAKLLWLKTEFPEVFQKTEKWLSFSDYLALKLFSKAVTSVSMASGTGIFNLRNDDWDDELVNFLQIKRENLPRIADDSETFRTNQWEQLKNAKWFLAIGDGAANNIGAGCLQKQKAALMIGTSGAMRVAFAGEIPKKILNGLWCYRIDSQKLIVGGALSDGGGLYRWLKDTMKIAEVDDEVEAEIKMREPDSHGLTFLPFLAGERSTGYHENAKGAILGLTQSTTAVEITQAAMESVAYRFAEIYDQLLQIVEIKTIIASGGALRESPVWTQIIADVFGQNLSLPDTHEASSRGVVLLALENLGKIKNIAELPTPEGNKFNFNQEKHEIYQKARKRHEHFYELLMNESAKF
ncbi:MAG TPA: gluconokinase [Pyrinomonadaceae bacterium]|nr:gluconokinase [Pyrinomonadaceae bacterium]